MSKETAAKVGFELHNAARLLRRNFDRRAREHGLTRARWQVLWHLARNEGSKQSELAEMLDVAPISMARQLDLLQREGLVERRADPTDRRCFRIFLTTDAAPVMETLKELAQQTRAEALAGLSAKEIEQTVRLLARIRENLSRSEE